MSLIANCHRDSKAKSQPFTPEDFYSKFVEEETPQMTPEQIDAWARMFTLAMGGKIGDDRLDKPDVESRRGGVRLQHAEGK